MNSSEAVLVSIIIPAYNTAPYIHRAIESSLRQTRKNVEVLVIDDGSTDDTLSIAEEYARRDERVRVFHQDNAGVSAARNCGIREAKGEYLTFLDSDDWLEDNAVEVMLGAGAGHPDKMVVADRYFVRYSEEDNKFYRTPHRRYKSSLNLSLPEAISQISSLELISVRSIMFPHEIISRYSLSFREGMHYGEDHLFAVECLFRTNGLVYVRTMTENCLVRPDSATHIPPDQRKHNNDNLLDALDRCKFDDKDIERLMHIHIARGRRFALSKALIKGAPIEQIADLRENCRKYMKEFLASRTIPPALKVLFCCEVFMPVPLARAASRMFFLRKAKVRARKNGEEEAIDFW